MHKDRYFALLLFLGFYALGVGGVKVVAEWLIFETAKSKAKPCIWCWLSYWVWALALLLLLGHCFRQHRRRADASRSVWPSESALSKWKHYAFPRAGHHHFWKVGSSLFLCVFWYGGFPCVRLWVCACLNLHICACLCLCQAYLDLCVSDCAMWTRLCVSWSVSVGVSFSECVYACLWRFFVYSVLRYVVWLLTWVYRCV